MRRLFYIVLLFLTLPVVAQEEKLRQHGFSVSDDRKVFFAPGNLQYNAAMGTHLCADGTMQQGTWRFSENQWDYIGKENEKISATYNGWIDLFGWGTSGWNSGATAYQPWAISNRQVDYIEATPHDMTGEYRYKDWAVYNSIGDDAPETWRTLTQDEWYYLLAHRPNSFDLYGWATVNGTSGLVLLPDNYSFSASLPEFKAAKDGKNAYTIEQWKQLEDAGAVFLPITGKRSGNSFYQDGACFYWNATQFYAENSGASCLLISYYSITLGSSFLYFGLPVRPVMDIPKNYVPTVKMDTTVCDTLLPFTWREHEWFEEGVIRDTLSSVLGGDSICLLLSLHTEKCCRELVTMTYDTTVCDTLLPYTWRGVVFAESGEKRIMEKSSQECDSIEHIYTLSTFHCEKLWPIIINKYNWQLLCDNVVLRQLLPERTPTAFQWYKNEQPIDGATDDDYAEQNELHGVFQLRVTLDNGQTIRSNIISILDTQDQQPLHLQVYNSQGVLIPEKRVTHGMYLFRYEQGEKVWTEKRMVP